MSSLESFKCCLNSAHLAIKEPQIISKCPSLQHDQSSGYKVACGRCIRSQLDYAGAFNCPVCLSEHRPVCQQNLETERIDFSSKLHASRIDIFKCLVKDLKSTRARLAGKDILVEFHLSNLLKQVLLTEKLGDRGSLINNTFEFIEHDSLVRVESLRIELERIEIDMLDHLDYLKFKSKSRVDRLCQKLQKLSNRARSIETLKQIQDQIQRMSQIYSSIQAEDNKPSGKSQDIIEQLKLMRNIRIFGKNQEKQDQKKQQEPFRLKKPRCLTTNPSANHTIMLERSLIGYLNCWTKTPVNLATMQVKLVNLSHQLRSACGLAEIFTLKDKYQLIITDFATDTVKYFRKYDSHVINETQMLKSLARFKQFKFKKLYAMCTDLIENVYICDMELHRILMYDLTMNRLKRIITGPKSIVDSQEDEFDCPRDICYYDNRIYVLDQGKRVVNVLTRAGDYVLDWSYESSLSQIENAWSIRVCSEFVAIVDWKQKVYLFDRSFVFKTTLNVLDVTSICIVDETVLMLHSENGDLTGYKCIVDDRQNIKPHLVLQRNSDHLKYRSEFMIYTSDQKLLLSLGWSKSIALISFK